MKIIYFNQLEDYLRHSVNNNICTGFFYISLFKVKSHNQPNTSESPQILEIYSVVVL